MSAQPLEDRVKALETEVAALRQMVGNPDKKGWQAFVGAFEGDETFKEAMELGRKYRESLRPKKKKKKKKSKS